MAIPPLRSLRLGVRRGFGDHLPVAGLDEIKRWILSFAPEAAVLEPEKLKEMVRKDLSRNLAQYPKSPVSINLIREIRAV